MSAPASSALASVLGRYAIGEEIARGGLATVHLGVVLGEAGFSRTVAVKRLLPAFARDPEFVTSFLDEAKLVSRIRHPNVVPTLDLLAQDGELFVVMEYVHGESLAGLVRAAADRDEPIPLGVVSAIIGDALQGLHAAHEAKDERGAPLHVIHRDVSLQNVIVGVDGVARVLDFGIAKAAGRAQTTREGQVKGKLGYLAPEQLRQKAERASDLYAAGVCLWEALTLRRLFAGDNESAVIAKIMAGLAPPPSKHVEGLPAALDAVALRALRRDPRERFATAREMAIALAAAAPPTPAAEIGAWVERLAAAGLAHRAAGIAAIEVEAAARPSERAAVVDTPAPAIVIAIEEEPTQRQDARATIVDAPPIAAPISPEESLQETLSSAPVITHPALEAVEIPPRPRSAWRIAALVGAASAMVTILAGIAWGLRSKPAAEIDVPPIAAADPTPLTLIDEPAPPPPAIPVVAPPDPIPATSVAPASSAEARPRPVVITGPRINCDPPYSIDSGGIRHYKKGCLR
jgi:eukaryotic-like serine/threonine-protein kinase